MPQNKKFSTSATFPLSVDEQKKVEVSSISPRQTNAYEKAKAFHTEMVELFKRFGSIDSDETKFWFDENKSSWQSIIVVEVPKSIFTSLKEDIEKSAEKFSTEFGKAYLEFKESVDEKWTEIKPLVQGHMQTVTETLNKTGTLFNDIFNILTKKKEEKVKEKEAV